MARTPRPVDPDEGPVQAFAVDLRALRESAGNPTYRTLAKTAGYSATTLGDAAGGMHLPTLEVTLAYVGACGGDADTWRTRWQEVAREVARERAGREEDVEQAEPAQPDVPDEAEAVAADPVRPDLPPARRSRVQISGPWIGVLAAATAAVLVAALTGAFSARQPSSTAAGTPHASVSTAHSAAASAHCPAVPAPGTAVAFTGMTYGVGANVRTGASLQSPVHLRIPPGCGVGFSGYCLGDVVTDLTAGTPDMRWFIIPGVGEVASAIVHGDPPGALNPQPCPQDVPGPAAISLGVASTGTGGGVVQLTATGSRLWIVGFAAYYPSAPGTAAQWHQFGFGADQTGGVFDSAPLRLDGAAGEGGAITVVAVACLGGDGPTDVAARAAVRSASPQTLLPAPALPAASLTAAEKAACAYPGSPAGS